MKKSRFSEQQVINILKQADAGQKVRDLCRQYAISDATCYKRKSKYGGREASDIRRPPEAEAENSRLKRMFADPALEMGQASFSPGMTRRNISLTLPPLIPHNAAALKQFSWLSSLNNS